MDVSTEQLAGALRRTLLDNTRLRAENARLNTGGDPVAIVGMACRLPGDVGSPHELWKLLESGAETVGDPPADRGWDLEAIFHPDPDHPGTSYCRHGSFLTDAAGFDAAFFGISPREATAMDPQQRILLEVAWEALEDAGIVPEALRSTSTGVFAGITPCGYGGDPQYFPYELDPYSGTGGLPSVASGRIAYTLGLRGPAVSVDTACSASLTAIHVARRALLNGDCTLALAGGVSVLPAPTPFRTFSRLRALAPDGRCKAFSAAADGMGMAEGAGLVVLERLSDAHHHGHRVLAVIRGSALNQDGASNGLTAPNGPSQQSVIRAALADADLQPGEIDAVETHGTGTPLGDPIEAEALLATYGRDRTGTPLLIGSLKSHIGHTMAAAGVAGVIATVLAIRHGRLPRSLHLDRPTPHVDWSAGGVRLLTETRPWPDAQGRPRRAGVSSFGISGTNAHLILEQAPPPPDSETPRPAPCGPPLWLLSGRTPAALRDQAAHLASHLAAHPLLAPDAVARALATTRTHFPHRAAVTGPAGELAATLNALAQGRPHPAVSRGDVPAGGPGKLVWVFPGQGSQWLGMGRELYETEPVFRHHLDACAKALSPWVTWDLLAVLRGDTGAPGLAELGVVQPALWAVMVSLARLWESYGITPDAVVGHSQGEIAAAHVAGALTLDDAALIVALRSRAAATLAGEGDMASLALGEADARRLLTPCGGKVSLAAVNGPGATVISGELRALEELVGQCLERDTPARVLRIGFPSHGPAMDRVRGEILTELAVVTPRPTGYAFHSSVEGYVHDTPLAGEELTAGYWWNNIRRTVRFQDSALALLAGGHTTYLEVSPHPTLLPALEATLQEAGGRTVVLGTLSRGDGGRPVATLTQLHLQGHLVDWRRVFSGDTTEPVDLPRYAFQHQRFWLSPGGHGATARATAAPQPAAVRPMDLTRDPEALLETVRSHMADALGHPGAEAIDPDTPLAALGFDSVTAVQLRRRLGLTTGLDLPGIVLLDHPTATALSGHLRALLTDPGQPEARVPASGRHPGVAPLPPDFGDAPATAAAPNVPVPQETSGPVSAARSGVLTLLVRTALEHAEPQAALDLITRAGRLLPGFSAPCPEEALPLVSLAESSNRPALICLPALLGGASPFQYSRLAAAFRGSRDVRLLPPPGYRPGARVPRTVADFARIQADVLRPYAGETVLLGHSSGGWAAYAVATELCAEGTPPAGIVLLDTPPPEQSAPSQTVSVLRRVLDRDDDASLDDLGLIATGAYLGLFADWAPQPLSVPTLLVRAVHALPGAHTPLDTWLIPGAVHHAEADHFSLLHRYAGDTACVIDRWLTATAPTTGEPAGTTEGTAP
ncbi:type I polyketide synthase [Streptomyces sp. NPDC058953]|uniref:type I polyketide synthase n=1 Tax=unclassified Streptomyces TaxID=2593676 RepID=UPI0036C1C241